MDKKPAVSPQNTASFENELVVPTQSLETANVTLGPQSAEELAQRARERQTAMVSAPAGYSIERELGRGGMGVVYLARQSALNRLVALKMILSGEHADPRELLRFFLEAEAIAAVRHPHVVQVFEFGDHEGLPFMALEYCSGGSLAARLSDGPLDARTAAELGRKLALGVQAAHDLGIVHRDLKPGNVLLDNDEPKITDFGLAKRGSARELTKTGAVMGTPSYMPPEQASGNAKIVGPAADIYALGAILYECLSGQPPFRGKNAIEIVLQVLNREATPLSKVCPGVPLDLATIIHKCLEKDPQKRYLTARELSEDLQRFLRGESVLARPATRRERLVRWARRHPWTAIQLSAGFLFLLVVAIGASAAAVSIDAARRDLKSVLSKEATARREAQANLEIARQAQQREASALLESKRQLVRLNLAQASHFADGGKHNESLLLTARAWANDPDGDRSTSHRLRLGLALLQKPELVGLAIHDEPLAEAQADDAGRRVVTRTTGGHASLWDIRAGQAIARHLKHEASINAVVIDAEGRWVVTGGSDGMVNVWDALTGKLLTRLKHGAPVRWLAWQPKSSRFVSVGGEPGVNFWDAETSAACGPKITNPHARCLSFSRDGKRFVTADEELMARVWQTETGARVGIPTVHRLRTPAEEFENTRRSPVLSPDGRYLLTSNGSYESKTYSLICTDLETNKQLWKTVHGTSGVYSQTFSPDGSKVACTHSKGQILDLVKGTVISRMDTPREAQFAAFMADGSIAYSSTGGLVQFWSTDAAPSPNSHGTLQAAEGVRTMSALADGRHLLIACGDGTARLYRIPDAVEADPSCGGRAHLRTAVAAKSRLRVFSPDASLECVYGGNEPILVGPRGQENHPIRLDVQPGMQNWARFCSDGSTILTITPEYIQAWSSKDGQAVGPAIYRDGAVEITLSKDGRRAALASPAKLTTRVVDVTNGKTLWSKTFPRPVELSGGYPAFDPTARRIACGDFQYGGTVEIWDIEANRMIQKIASHRGMLQDVQLSPDGQEVLVCSSDTTARLWSVETGEPLGPMLRHNTFCRRAVPNNDGRYVATSDANGLVQLWDCKTGERLSAWGPYGKGITNIWFSLDKKALYSQYQGSIRMIRFTEFQGPLEHLPPYLELISGLRIDPNTEAFEILPADHFMKRADFYLNAWREMAGVKLLTPSALGGTPATLPHKGQ